jgi:hypothetical protein
MGDAAGSAVRANRPFTASQQRLGDDGAEAGVHPKVVQERLGHAGIAITLDVYSHVTEGLHGDAANLVGGLIAGTLVSSALANAGGGDQ